MADTLKQWAEAGKLSEAQLSSDGRSLMLEGTTLEASQETEVSYEAKSCRYTLASMFLQISDPDQGLMAYRNACKKHAVKDPVKALDKPVVVAFFLGAPVEPQAPATAEASAVAAVPAKVTKAPHSSSAERGRSEKHHKRSKEERRTGSSSDRKRHREKSAEKPKKRVAKQPMTTEQLFSNLSEVVDKRTLPEEQREQEEIHKALSAEGFDVTEELLKPHRASLEAMTHEIPVGNSASILRPATAVERDFSRVLELYNETVKPVSSSKQHKANSSPAAKSSTDRTFLEGKTPIIVLPKGMSAPITMVNAYEFFANSKFVPRNAIGKTVQKPPTTFTRKFGGKGMGAMMEYELMDNPRSKLGQDARQWQRIVAVIALGQAWQFKDWPGRYSDPVHIFGRTYGFYIGMEGDKIPTELEGWAVRKGKLNRDKRGLDSVTYASFWNGLDEWMAIHKPELLPTTTT